MMFGHWGYGGFQLYHIIGFIINLLIFGVISGLIVLLIVRLTGKKSKNSEAMEILKKRFASGEITKEQFDEIKSGIE